MRTKYFMANIMQGCKKRHSKKKTQLVLIVYHFSKPIDHFAVNFWDTWYFYRIIKLDKKKIVKLEFFISKYQVS